MKLLPFVLTLTAAASLIGAPEKRSPVQTPPNCDVGLAPGKYSERSIFRLNANWTDDSGKSLHLESFRGRPVVLALIFTSCEHSCPFIVKDMKAMRTALSGPASQETQFVLVSIDPDRDSPAALKAFRTKHRLTGERWTLLTGGRESIRQLAEKIGFNYAPGSQTQFAHSLLLTVLDGKGEVAHQQTGLGVDRRGAVMTIEKLMAEKKAR
jgi:protein SCO1/2